MTGPVDFVCGLRLGFASDVAPGFASTRPAFALAFASDVAIASAVALACASACSRVSASYLPNLT